MKHVVWILVVTAVYVLFLRETWSQVSADFNYALAQRALKDSDYPHALELSQRARSQNPNEPRYFYGKAKVLLTQLPNSSKGDILHLLVSAENISPHNLVTLRNIAPFYYYLAVEDLKKPEGIQNIDQTFLPITLAFLEKLSVTYPDDVGVQVLTATYERKLGQTELFNSKIEKIRLLRPDLLEWQPGLK